MASLMLALNAIDRASYVARAVAGRLGPQHPGAAHLAAELFALESQAAQHFSALTHRPLIAPDPSRAGAWAERARLMLGPVGQAIVPDGFVEAADALIRRAEAMAASASPGPAPTQQFVSAGQPPQPYQQPVEGGPPVATGPGNHELFRKILGSILALAGVGVSAATGWNLYKRGVGGFPPEANSPDAAQHQGQALLDGEIPGASLSLRQTTSGGWVASVRKSGRVISRQESTIPGEAVDQVTRQALSATVLDGEVLAEPVEEKKDAILAAAPAPRAPRKPKTEKAVEKPIVEKVAEKKAEGG